jgi:hypothetical protein
MVRKHTLRKRCNVTTSAILLVILGVLASAAAVATLWGFSVRASHQGQMERRLQTVLNVYAEREIARESVRKNARKDRNYSPHGTVLQLR